MYILRGERYERFYDRVLSKKSLFELEHFKFILVELDHLPEHLIEILFGGNTMA